MSRLIFQFAIISLFLFSNCAQPHPEILIEQDNVEVKLPPYARHLKGYKICLDPGHGGQGHIPDYKRGPTGLPRSGNQSKGSLFSSASCWNKLRLL